MASWRIDLGQASASQAVARANGSNQIALMILPGDWGGCAHWLWGQAVAQQRLVEIETQYLERKTA